MKIVDVDISQFLLSWTAMRSRMDRQGKLAFDRAVKDAWHQMQGFGYNNQTNTLTRSMKWKTVQRGSFSYSGEVSANADYAAHVNWPTQPHNIPGPGKGPSVFFWPKVGHWVKFTSDRPARHPGSGGAGFDGAAAQAFLTTAPMLMEHAIGEAAND